MVSTETLRDKTILITGGTGTFGRAFVKEVLKYNPKAIRIYSRSEYWQYEMKEQFKDDRLRFFIGDVRDKERLKIAMKGVDIVVHAAALKRVEVCEYNPFEAVQTNIVGSMNVVLVAHESGVKKLLAVSSDKAVHPINTYGKTKSLMEDIIINGNVYGDTMCSCIRSGNFEMSSGSVLSIWENQFNSTGCITVTDKDMTRYFIRIEDIAEFAIECLDMLQGGEIFIPKMGKRKIMDLAQALHPEARIEFIGKAPGEKLEELLYSESEEMIEADNYYLICK